jgi:hypothetical protein
VEGPCEHSNEPLGSIKCWEILAAQLADSQEGLSSMELVKGRDSSAEEPLFPPSISD